MMQHNVLLYNIQEIPQLKLTDTAKNSMKDEKSKVVYYTKHGKHATCFTAVLLYSIDDAVSFKQTTIAIGHLSLALSFLEM